MTDTNDYLASLDSEYEATAPASGGSTLPPPGKYDWEITDAEIVHPHDKAPSIKLTLSVMDGPHQGLNDYYWISLEARRLPYLKKDIQTLDIRMNRPSELPNLLPDFIGIMCRGEVKLSKQKKQDGSSYRNVYINEAVKRDPLEEIPF